HAAGILHRDLKPDNLFLDRARGLLVGDLGIAKDTLRSGVATTYGVLVGTPAYMAPELARGGAASPQSDLYALGVVLFECLTGRVPFNSDNPVELLTLHWTAPIPSARDERPELPPAVDGMLAKVLAKKVEQRPWDARAFVAELRNLPRTEQERPVSGHNRTVRMRVSQAPAGMGTRHVSVRGTTAPRPRWFAWVATAAVAVAMLGGLAFWRSARPTVPPPSPVPAASAARPTNAASPSSQVEQVSRASLAALASSNQRLDKLLQGVAKDPGTAGPDEVLRKVLVVWGEGIASFDRLWEVQGQLRAAGESRADRLTGRTLAGIFALFLHTRTELKAVLDLLRYRTPGVPFLGKKMSDEDRIESFDAGVGTGALRLWRTLPMSLERTRGAAWVGGRCVLVARTRRSPQALHINALSREVTRLAEDALTRLGAHGPEAEPDMFVTWMVLEALKYVGIREARLKLEERVLAPLEAAGPGQRVDRREELIRAMLGWDHAMLLQELKADMSHEVRTRLLAEFVRLRERLARDWAGEPEPTVDPVPGVGDSLADLLNAKASFMEASAKQIRELALEVGAAVPALSK
ncbi:MAG: serine/threonine protein kinase, partial [Candidatus Wallbacteria bacterium]|nr:serine/threonine protein kinase [Candidatus Wallbacteria bacterium]